MVGCCEALVDAPKVNRPGVAAAAGGAAAVVAAKNEKPPDGALDCVVVAAAIFPKLKLLVVGAALNGAIETAGFTSLAMFVENWLEEVVAAATPKLNRGAAAELVDDVRSLLPQADLVVFAAASTWSPILNTEALEMVRAKGEELDEEETPRKNGESDFLSPLASNPFDEDFSSTVADNKVLLLSLFEVGIENPPKVEEASAVGALKLKPPIGFSLD